MLNKDEYFILYTFLTGVIATAICPSVSMYLYPDIWHVYFIFYVYFYFVFYFLHVYFMYKFMINKLINNCAQTKNNRDLTINIDKTALNVLGRT